MLSHRRVVCSQEVRGEWVPYVTSCSKPSEQQAQTMLLLQLLPLPPPHLPSRQ